MGAAKSFEPNTLRLGLYVARRPRPGLFLGFAYPGVLFPSLTTEYIVFVDWAIVNHNLDLFTDPSSEDLKTAPTLHPRIFRVLSDELPHVGCVTFGYVANRPRLSLGEFPAC